MMALLIVVYVIGAVFTGWFNLEIIIGGVKYPWAIVRNALLWPVFLPLIIIVVVWAMARER